MIDLGNFNRVICPYCSDDNDKVIDSRSAEDGRAVRRRRRCLKCDRRFTTYERVEQTARLVVVKRDGSRVPFNRENITRGVEAACGKRPIPQEVKDRLVEQVEEELHRDFEREVDSRTIGDRVMARLRDVDEVAYVRFASEYYQFRSVGEIVEQLGQLASHVREAKDQQKLFER